MTFARRARLAPMPASRQSSSIALGRAAARRGGTQQPEVQQRQGGRFRQRCRGGCDIERQLRVLVLIKAAVEIQIADETCHIRDGDILV